MSRSKYRPRAPRWWTPYWRNIDDRKLRRYARVLLKTSTDLEAIIIPNMPTIKGYFD